MTLEYNILDIGTTLYRYNPIDDKVEEFVITSIKIRQTISSNPSMQEKLDIIYGSGYGSLGEIVDNKDIGKIWFNDKKELFKHIVNTVLPTI